VKKLILIISLISLFHFHGNGQPCLPQGIHFSNQFQIDSFQINYPNCSEIQGDVRISELWSGNINDLNGLSVITSIGGDLSIDSVFYLTSLDGLDDLSSIGGDLKLICNPKLISISKLSNLIFIGNDLIIGGNTKLTSLTGLEGITNISGMLAIGKNGKLLDLTGLNNLQSIGDRLHLNYNYNLKNFSGFDNLITIGGSFDLWSNGSLINFSGLGNLTYIGGGFLSNYSTSLISFSGMDKLTTIDGPFWIDHNDSLIDFSGLTNLKSINGEINLWANTALSSLSGLENVSPNAITDLSIYDNTSLSGCAVKSICKYLDSPNGTVFIYNNANGCNSQTEVIQDCNNSLYSITGRITYDDTLNPHQSLSDVGVYLTTLIGEPEDSTISDQNGDYQIKYLSPGDYHIQSSCTKPWGGGNSTDALMIMQHFVNLYNLSGLKLKAADADNSGYINTMDALYVAQRFVFMINSFPAGDWIFESDSITINNSNVNLNLKGLCTGDVDGSHIIP
jgi:hypothetical protein